MDRRGLVIFDLDGTLFRADAVTVPAVIMSFETRDLTPPPESKIRYFIGRPMPEFHAWLDEVSPPGIGPEIARDVDRTEIELVPEAGDLFPGVLDVLITLRESVARMAVCTNGPRPYVEAVIKAYNLAPYFDAIRFLQHDGDDKIGMVRELLERFDERPGIVVGDRPDDIEAAHRNGLAAIAVSYGLGTPGELAAADAVADSPTDLPGLVSKLIEERRGRDH